MALNLARRDFNPPGWLTAALTASACHGDGVCHAGRSSVDWVVRLQGGGHGAFIAGASNHRVLLPVTATRRAAGEAGAVSVSAIASGTLKLPCLTLGFLGL